MRKQMQNMKNIDEYDMTQGQTKKLGFATPAPDNEQDNHKVESDENYESEEPIV